METGQHPQLFLAGCLVMLCAGIAAGKIMGLPSAAIYFAGGRGPYGMAPELFVLAGVFVIVFRSGNDSLYGGG